MKAKNLRINLVSTDKTRSSSPRWYNLSLINTLDFLLRRKIGLCYRRKSSSNFSKAFDIPEKVPQKQQWKH